MKRTFRFGLLAVSLLALAPCRLASIGQGRGQVEGSTLAVGTRLPEGEGLELRNTRAACEEDLTAWEYWWMHNQGRYLCVRPVRAAAANTPSHALDVRTPGVARDPLSVQPPDAATILGEILPALRRALDMATDEDSLGSALFALAKVGRNGTDFRLLDLFRPHLAATKQSVREVAALAIGLAGPADADQVDLLRALALDEDLGRKAVASPVVDLRTRTFALYGLGLLAHGNPGLRVSEQVFFACRQVLEDARLTTNDLPIAAIQASSLLDPGDAGAGARHLLLETVQMLTTYYAKAMAPELRPSQAFCATALARLLGRADPEAGRCMELFADELRGKGGPGRYHEDLARAAALALGQMCPPFAGGADAKQAAGKYSQLLFDTYQQHADEQTRYFAVLALGQIGGAENRRILMGAFEGAEGNAKDWIALALGILSRESCEVQQRGGGAIEPDREIGKLLHEVLGKEEHPGRVAAYAVALGLSGCREAADDLRRRMVALLRHSSTLVEHLLSASALLDDSMAVDALLEVVAKSKRGRLLLVEALPALPRLGSRAVAERLLGWLGGGDSGAPVVASALGVIGDGCAVKGLVGIVVDAKQGQRLRGAAVHALGNLAEAGRRGLPWNWDLLANIDYRAAPGTLMGGSTGVVDWW
jgi:HEAT repeat protein